MIRRLLATGGLVLAASAAAVAGESSAPAVDWQQSYWRYTLSLRPPEFTPPFKDHKGRTVQFLNYQRGWHIGFTSARVRSGDAPEGWTAPEFNDSAWMCRKGGLAEGGTWYDPAVRAACLRSRFEVADPAKVTGLELEVRYMGGVAVWLNGRELGRGHLAAGPLSGETMAEPYPPEAYAWGIPINKHGYAAELSEWQAPDEKSDRFRRLTVKVDPKLLVKGANVLAVAVHRAGYGEPAAKWSYEAMNGYKNTPWPHLAVLALRLRAEPAGAVAAPARPAGVQVWAEDIHRRLVNRDWVEPGLPPPVIRILAARNGVGSGQVVIGTAAALGGLSARMSDLEAAGGGKIPAAAAEVRWAAGLPLDSQLEARFGRHGTYYNWSVVRLLEGYAFGTGFRFKDMGDRANPKPEVRAEAKAIALFDQLAAQPPREVPAGSCQPVWLTVRVPKDAPAGLYRGTLTLTAGVEHRIEVRLQVMDWGLPDARDFGTYCGLQQSLEGPAAQYKCALWSDEHWKHLERSAKLLAELGNDLAVLPLVTGGEAAGKESIVAWVRKGDPST
ncbi:MAG TPA: hypothetical protein PK280_01525, partial [Planctomycetota bacterium]|nr:hypothetical protein [Planctomycetota bacterium]